MMNTISYIKAGWLIDGTGGPIREKVVLRVVDGLITSMERYSDDVGLERNKIVDLSSCIILPPLVDSHIHLFMSGTIDKDIREKQLVAGYEALCPVISQHLQSLFSHGVLAVRDGGDRGGFAMRYKKEREVHPVLDVKVAGRAYHVRGRYGGLIGRCPGDDDLVAAYEKDTEEKEFLKIVNSGLNSLKVYGKETPPQFSTEALAAVVRVAGKKGQKVMVHANGREPVKNAVEAGCHSIEHGFFMGKENLQRMADKGTRWIPTVFTMEAYGRNLRPGEKGVDHKVLQKNVEHQLEQLRMAREFGVDVVLGTDAGSLGVVHGESMTEEMELFNQAGFTVPEIVRCATVRGAELLGVDIFGPLTVGNPATFLVTRGDPSQLPGKLSYLENIYIDGRPSKHFRKIK